jgi:hypothetical protein
MRMYLYVFGGIALLLGLAVLSLLVKVWVYGQLYQWLFQ